MIACCCNLGSVEPELREGLDQAMQTNNWPQSVGVIGLGIMGSSVARHLAKAERTVIGFDTDATRGATIVGSDIRLARSAAAVAEEADLLFTSLPSQEALEATISAIGNARR